MSLLVAELSNSDVIGKASGLDLIGLPSAYSTSTRLIVEKRIL